jgi:hypothetical protein
VTAVLYTAVSHGLQPTEQGARGHTRRYGTTTRLLGGGVLISSLSPAPVELLGGSVQDSLTGYIAAIVAKVSHKLLGYNKVLAYQHIM